MSLFRLHGSVNLAQQGRRRGGYFPSVGARAVPAGGAIHSVPGRLGHQPAGITTGARGARWTGTGSGRGNARSNCARSAPPGWGERIGPNAPVLSWEAWPGAEPWARKLPLARTVVGRRQASPPPCLPRTMRDVRRGGAAPKGADILNTRLSAFRFLYVLAREA